MRKLHHKILAFMLLLALPLQGLSAALMSVHCASTEQHATTPSIAADDHVSSDHTEYHSSSTLTHHDGNTVGNDIGHFCCSHVSAGVPSFQILTTPDAQFVPVNLVYVTPPLFYPERLLRPPRS